MIGISSKNKYNRVSIAHVGFGVAISAVILLGASYAVAAARPDLERIQLACALVAVFALAILLAALAVFISNRKNRNDNNKKDDKQNATSLNGSIPNSSSKIPTPPPEPQGIPIPPPLPINGNAPPPPPPPPLPTPEQLNQAGKQNNGNSNQGAQAINEKSAVKSIGVEQAGAKNFVDELNAKFKSQDANTQQQADGTKPAPKIVSALQADAQNAKPVVSAAVTKSTVKATGAPIPDLHAAVQQRRAAFADSMTESQLGDTFNSVDSVNTTISSTTPITSQEPIIALSPLKPLPIPPIVIFNGQNSDDQQNVQVKRGSVPPPPPLMSTQAHSNQAGNTNNAKPAQQVVNAAQAGAQNVRPVLQSDFAAAIKDVKLKKVEKKDNRQPATGAQGGIFAAVGNKVGSIMTGSVIAKPSRVMTDSQYSTNSDSGWSV